MLQDPVVERLAADPAFARDYDLRAVLGRGGMAVVARAIQRSTGREVAVKVLVERPEASSAERFVREGRVLARLRHASIVQVFDVGLNGEYPYMVLELASGGSLADEIGRAGRVGLERAVAVLAPCLRGLAACHEAGVLHRDLKPDNILFGADGQPRLADFGLALPVQSSHRLTAPGVFVGTVRYTAPEVLLGRPATPASDTYAIGATLYELLAGRPAFHAGELTRLFAMIVNEDAPPLASLCPELPSEVHETVDLLLAKDPARRPADAARLADRMAGWDTTARPGRRARQVPTAIASLRPRSIAHRPARAGGAIAIGLALSAAVVSLAWRTTPPAPPAPPSASARPAVALAPVIAEVRGTDRVLEFVVADYKQLVAETGSVFHEGDDTPARANKLIAMMVPARSAMRQRLEPLRAQENRDFRAQGWLARGIADEFTITYLTDQLARLAGAPPDPRREAEALSLFGACTDAYVEAVRRAAADPSPDPELLALILVDLRDLAHGVAWSDWSPARAAQYEARGAALVAALERTGSEQRPIGRAASAAWGWGSRGNARQSDRAALRRDAAILKTLARALPAGAPVAALAASMEKEGGL